MAEELKKLRDSSKRKVVNLVRKLTVSLQYGDNNASSLKDSLDEEYDTLFDLDLQVVQLEDDASTFLDDITPSYDNVIKLFYNSLKEDVAIKKQKEAIPLRKTVERSYARLNDIIKRLKVNLKLEPSTVSNVTSIGMEEDKSSLLSTVDILLKDISSLGELIDITDLEVQINSVVSIADNVGRDVNIFMKLTQLESGLAEKSTKSSSNLSYESPAFAPRQLLMSGHPTSQSVDLVSELAG